MLAPDGRRLGPNEIFFMLARDRRAFFYAGHEKHFLLIGQALRRAAEAGVQVVCYGCRVEADSIEIVSDPVCSPTKFCPITA